MREDEKMHKAGVLKHVKEIISKVSKNILLSLFSKSQLGVSCQQSSSSENLQIRTVSDKLGNILEYHQVSLRGGMNE